MNKLLQYTSPAAYIFETDKTYSLDVLENEYHLSMDMIKVLFTPVNFTWDDIEGTPVVPVENETQSTEVPSEPISEPIV